jgi:hypothetical protein
MAANAAAFGSFLIESESPMKVNIKDLSRLTHNIFFRDADQSLCSRAWTYRNEHWFWAIWVRIFTTRHCERSYRFHRVNLKKSMLQNRNDIQARCIVPLGTGQSNG